MKIKVLSLMGPCYAWRPHMVRGWGRRTERRSGEEKGQEEEDKRGKKKTLMGQRFWGFRAIATRYLIRILNGKGFIFIFLSDCACTCVYTHMCAHKVMGLFV